MQYGVFSVLEEHLKVGKWKLIDIVFAEGI